MYVPRMLLILLAAAAPRPDATAFACEGRPAPPPEAPPRATGPMRLLRVEALAGPAAAVPDAPEDLLRVLGREAATRTFSVYADNAPLGAVAVELARVSGVRVVVTPAVAEVPVTVALPVVTFLDAMWALRACCGVFPYAAQSNAVVLGGRLDYAAKLRTQESSPLVRHVASVPPRLSASSVAAAWCAQLATPRGRASVIGRQIVVIDIEATTGMIDDLIAGL